MRLRRAAFALAALLVPGAARAASQPAVESTKFMVVSAQRLASEAGAEVLRQGGNAIDAAVAIGYALAVVYPCCGNIGGGGFMTIHLADGRDIFLNFRETAPAAASANMYLGKDGAPVMGSSLFGWRAVAVPGTVLGLDTALREYGTFSRAAVMADAIRLARDGFVLNTADADLLSRVAPHLRDDAEAARIFLHPDGTPLQTGEKLVQTDLATTLEAIAEDGPDAFYQGDIPAAVEAASHAGGGLLTAKDFAAYRVTESAPLRCTYRDNLVLSAPPPSSGGVSLCEILNILEGYDLHHMGFHSAQSVHVMAEAMRLAYYDRNRDLGDPEFVKDPIARLISKEYAAKLRARIGPRATPSSSMPPLDHESSETTHYSVLDGQGNAVSVTYTLNGGFGAGVMAPGAGVLMNDEMDDFTIKPDTPNLYGLVQGKANAIAPGKRPLSSMAPTIVMHNGHVRMVLGSPGGARIITIVAEVLSNVIDYDMTPQEAVDAPRFHHQWEPDEIFAEPLAFSPDTEHLLYEMGYSVSTQTPWGAAELIVVGPRKAPTGGPPSSGNDAAVSMRLLPDHIYGASDPRRSAGAAIGN